MPPIGDHASSRTRAERAWRLRCAGRTWQEIADTLKYKNRSSALNAVDRLLKKDPPEDVGIQRKYTAEGYRIVQAALFESLATAQSRKDVHQVVNVSRAITDVMDRRAKLLGLHVVVPQQLDVTVHQSAAAVLERAESELLALAAAHPPQLPVLDVEAVEVPA